MERDTNQKDKNSGSSTSKAAVVGAGIVCSVLGAVIGAFGYHLWTKEEEMQRQKHSHSGSEKVYNNGPCPICLGEMEELKVLPCGHQYHVTCTEQLRDAEANPRCPICRKLVKE